MARLLGTIFIVVLAAGCATVTPSATTPPQVSVAPNVTATPAAPPGATPTAGPASASSSPVAATAPASAPASLVPPPSPTAAVVGTPYDQLLGHIPPDLQGDCHEVTSFDAGFLLGIQCINIPSLDGYVTYYQFDTVDNLDTSYQGNLDFFGEGADGTTCAQGPSAVSYTIDGASAGQVFCNDYDGGIIGNWTDEALVIESSIVLFSGTYADWHTLWLEAGPLRLPDRTPPTSAPTAAIGSWTTSASEHYAQIGQQFAYVCPSGGAPYPIYGTDIYTSDSSVCTAAVHMGLITIAGGGSVVIEMRPGEASYAASERNGVASYSWSSYDSSYVFVTP